MAGIFNVLKQSKVWQWLVNLSSVVKVLAILVPALVSAFIFYNKQIIKKYEKEKLEIQQTQIQSALVDSVSALSREVRSVKPELRKTNKKIDEIVETVSIVKTQLGNHIVKTSSDKQDILDWMNAFEKKNSSPYGTQSFTGQ
jgi:hypothetical protein